MANTPLNNEAAFHNKNMKAFSNALRFFLLLCKEHWLFAATLVTKSIYFPERGSGQMNLDVDGYDAMVAIRTHNGRKTIAGEQFRIFSCNGVHILFRRQKRSTTKPCALISASIEVKEKLK